MLRPTQGALQKKIVPMHITITYMDVSVTSLNASGSICCSNVFCIDLYGGETCSL